MDFFNCFFFFLHAILHSHFSSRISVCDHIFACVEDIWACFTNLENEVVLDGVLVFASRRPQSAARPFGALLLLTRGLPAPLCPLGGACRGGGVGGRVGGCGGGRRNLERVSVLKSITAVI